jgi:hypothetical protein
MSSHLLIAKGVLGSDRSLGIEGLAFVSVGFVLVGLSPRQLAELGPGSAAISNEALGSFPFPVEYGEPLLNGKCCLTNYLQGAAVKDFDASIEGRSSVIPGNGISQSISSSSPAPSFRPC